MFFLILSILSSLEEDGDLVRRLKERDSEAMNELYVRFGRLALAVIHRIVRDHATAEDLLQETFLRVWNRVASFDQDRGAFGPWILTIARNRAIDHLRSLESRHVDTGVDMARLERTSFFADVEREYSDQDSIRRIRSAFTKLSENQRMVLELAYFEGLSQTEMADRLNQPLGTVKTWVRTALQILRQELTNAALGGLNSTAVSPSALQSEKMADTLRTFIGAEQIQERVAAMGRAIDADSPEGPLYLIAILKGSFIFLADLARAIKHPVRIEFMAISSYAQGKTSSGQVKVLKDLDVNIQNQNLLIVEDIVDSGITLNYLMRLFEQRHPKSIRIATLLDKPDRRIQHVDIQYTGFTIPDEFVVGYGLDYAEDFRNLPDICILEQ